jgi:hypothetical protein
LIDITLSKARKITPVITRENSGHWIELAKTLPKPKLEKEVAKVVPQALTPERARYVTETRIELKLGLSEDLMKKLRRAQDLVSQKARKPATLEETLGEILEIFMQKQDPLEKAKRKIKQGDDASASVPGTRYVSADLKHFIHLRDQGRCSHIHENGQRCTNQRWLEIHHKIPLSRNGTNEIKNLQTLCHAHHRQRHLFQ